MGKKNDDRLPPDSEGASGAGADDVSLGDDESSLEAPRRPRSKAQVAAFEKMIAARNAKRAPRMTTASSSREEVEDDSRQPPEPEPAAPPPTPKPKPRKQRADKGKRRGHLIRAVEESYDDEYELQRVPTANLYGNFIIV